MQGLYAIGDVCGAPWLAHKASHEGVICVEGIAGSNHAEPFDASNVPGCTYSHPQVASVGLTEAAAKEAGYDIKVGRFPFIGNGKAIALGAGDGMVKTIFDKKTGELLGAHMIGAEVTELIQGYVIARQGELTEQDLMHTIFPHPTLSEMMHEAVLDSEDRALTILKLASLPDEVVDAVVCVLSRLAFDFALWSNGAIPILLVCEEAHRYASADKHAGFAPARRALKRIAREGRKYGVHLGLVTQRPSELDPTIISQCSTFFVMRMTNDADQALLRAAVSEAAANLLGFVPSLGAQEAIGIGEGLPLVARLTFATLPREDVPRSDSGARSEAVDAGPTDRAEIVRPTIERWRRATTSQAPASDARDTMPAEVALSLRAPADPGRPSILRR